MSVVTNENYKEVYFGEYCKTCKSEKVDEKDAPCNECLEEPANYGSVKPVKWEAKDKAKR